MVDRKTVLTNLKNFYAWKFKNYPLNFDEAQVIIEALETETPHAKWIYRGGFYDKIECSNCHTILTRPDGMNFKGCPCCLARMDGE